MLTGIPNYPVGTCRAPATRRRDASVRERLDGVRVTATPLYPSHDAKAREADPELRLLGDVAAPCSASGATSRRRALVYSSPATAALPAMVARSALGHALRLADPGRLARLDLLVGFPAPDVPLVPYDALWICSFIARTPGPRTSSSSRPGWPTCSSARGVAAESVYAHLQLASGPETQVDPAQTGPTCARAVGLADDDFVFMYAGNHGARQALDAARRRLRRRSARERCTSGPHG